MVKPESRVGIDGRTVLGQCICTGCTVVGQRICTGRTVLGQCRSNCRGAVVEELLPRSNTPVDSTDLFRIMMPAERGR